MAPYMEYVAQVDVEREFVDTPTKKSHQRDERLDLAMPTPQKRARVALTAEMQQGLKNARDIAGVGLQGNPNKIQHGDAAHC